MIWLELGSAALGGAVVGWFAHAWIRIRRRTVRAPKTEEGPAPSTSSPPNLESPVTHETASIRVTAARAVSTDADTAGRVILHLASLGKLAYDDVGLVGHTQAGMTRTLGIRQGTLTKVLSRLVAAKVIEVDRRHVHGKPRRLNVYRLTALGESVARDIRRRDPGVSRDGGTALPK